MDPDLAKRINPVVAPSPFVLQSSALHASDDSEDVCVCYVFAISLSLYTVTFCELNSLIDEQAPLYTSSFLI